MRNTNHDDKGKSNILLVGVVFVFSVSLEIKTRCDMSDQMCKSICKSKVYGETAERTAEEHGCTPQEVRDIWAKSTDYINELRAFLKEMGCVE